MPALAPDRPSMVGRYRLIATLGRGGMAEVYLAVAQGPAGFNKLLVCKVLRPLLADDETFRTMFLDEARLAARLNHPNVVQTFEVGEDEHQQFLLMEYLEGQPLHRVISRLEGAFTLDLRVRVLALVLAGLQSAHDLRDFDGTPLGVVHRDVSPPNVFVTYDGQVKLMDFGIAKTVQASNSTTTGVIKGKISYMAPEQALGEPLDQRADVFAVGVMLWEALVGRRLNADDSSEVATLRKRISTPVESPLVHCPETDPALVAICMRAVAFAPADRFASAQEMQESLEGYLDQRGLAARPRDLGRLLSEGFAEQRERLRGVIEQQLSAAATNSALTLVELGKETTGSRGGTALAAEPASFVGRAGKPRGKLAVAAAVVLPLAIAAIATVRFASHAPPTDRVAAPTATPTATAIATPTAMVASAPVPTAAVTVAATVAATVAPTAVPAAVVLDAATPAASVASAASTASAAGGASPPPLSRHVRPASGSRSSRTVDDKDPYAP